MEILKLVSFGITTALVLLVVGKYNGASSAFSMIIRLATVTIFMIFIVGELGNIFSLIRELANKVKMESTYLSIILKIIGIAYIAEFGYQLCKDAGEEAIGSKIQLAGKVMIFTLSTPIIFALIDLMADLL